ncbi:MAG TPA: PHB depolymerase family esterase [Polyangiaceae bacterium]|nr:PHB depolymerase family esterase [Polyangiaceae bacterium]
MRKYLKPAAALTVLTLAMSACPSAEDGDSAVNEVAQADTGGLPALNIDLASTSVSGLSAGGFMAVQFHIAYSSILRGAAIFAGGPYDCAEGSLSTALTTCTTASPSPPDPSRAETDTRNFASAGAIDDPSNLAGQRVFLFGGADDATVAPPVMDALASYYRFWVTHGDVHYESRRPGTAHTMPTIDYGGNCDVTGDPWIGKCNYDGAGAALSEIYGTLASPATTLSGQFVPMAQGAFLTSPASHSIADTGYAYIPKSCSDGARCRIHVAFHGCKQYATGSVADKFYKHAGYNEWADTNQIVMLYPQTIPTSGTNPNGCWDWWGYDNPDYAKRNGPQMAMVRRMIDALSGQGGTDAGAGDAGDASDAASPADAGKDSGTCFVANNFDHVAAGRAYVWFGYTFADGSNENMGLYSLGIVTSLRQIGPGDYVIGTCP